MRSRAQLPRFFLVAAAFSLAAGCAGGSSEAEPPETSTTRPSTSTSSQPEGTTAGVDTGAVAIGAECDDAVAPMAGESSLGPEMLDAFGFAAPQACSSLHELREAVAAHDLVGLDEFVISSCVAGDAWALLGEPSLSADTELCREARSRYTLIGNRRLAPARPVHSEDFSAGCGSWPSRGSSKVRFLCGDGDYGIVVLEPRIPMHSVIPTEQPYGELSVETDVALVAPETAVNALFGVSCWPSDRRGYVFVLGLAGQFAIARLDRASDRSVSLAQGETPRAIPGVGLRNRIRGECSAGPDATHLTLYVNGDRVAAARDENRTKSFEAVGLYVVTAEPGTDVRFDNVLVRVPSG